MIWRKRSKQQLFLSKVIKLILILFGVNLSCNSNLQHSTKIILIEKEGIFFNEKTNKPYTGEIVKYYKNGKKYTSRSYLEGKKMAFIIFGMQMDKLVERKIGMRVKEMVNGKAGTKTAK